MNLILSSDLFEEITGYRASPLLPVAKEKRDAPRLPIVRRAWMCRLTDGKTATAQPVMLREISTTGIGLLSPESFLTDERFTVAVPRRNNNVLTILCSVVRCERRGSGRQQFVIGAVFINLVTGHAETVPEPIAPARRPPPPADDEIRRIQRAMFDSK